MPDKDPYIMNMEAPPDDVMECIDCLRKVVTGEIMDGAKGIPPTIALMVIKTDRKPGPDNKMRIITRINTDFNTRADKNAAMKKLAKKLHENNMMPVMAVLSSEAWMAKISQEEIEESGGVEGVAPPSQRADREEVIVVGSLALHPPSAFCDMLPVERDSDNNLVVSGKWVGVTKSLACNILSMLYHEYMLLCVKKCGETVIDDAIDHLKSLGGDMPEEFIKYLRDMANGNDSPPDMGETDGYSSSKE